MTETAKQQENADNQPGIQILAQFIKDFSFENPNAPESLVSGWGAPEINVQIALQQKPLKDGMYECLTHFRVEAKKKGEDRIAFIADLHYGALTAIKNIPKENHNAIMMIEVPKMLFPFAREIISNATAQGGYPPLFLTPISFENIYINEMKRQQAEGGKVAKA